MYQGCLVSPWGLSSSAYFLVAHGLRVTTCARQRREVWVLPERAGLGESLPQDWPFRVSQVPPLLPSFVPSVTAAMAIFL